MARRSFPTLGRMGTSRLADVALVLCGVGVALHLYTVAFKAEGELNTFLVLLFLWSCAPYGLSAALSRFGGTEIPALGAVALCLAADVVMHYSVFVAPRGSTAGLGLLFMPIWNFVVLGPIGGLIAWSLFRVATRRGNAP
jgi:hypothetical protein